MAISYNSVDIRGVAAEPIIEEILFENVTIAEGLVTFEDNVKAETIFTESTATATLQAYTSGVPTAAGSLDAFDTVVTPAKGQFYQEFDPNTIRFSRFKRDMKPGIWNTLSTEFERIVIGGIYAKKVSLALENAFWNNVSAGTKTAVAALTAGTGNTSVGAAEKTLVAALPTTASMAFDGILAKMVYNSSNATATAGVGGRVKVAGTTITSSNIKAEYDKVYAAIPAVVLNSGEMPYIYAPKSHKQLINIFNNDPAQFKTAFSVNDAKTEYYFNGVQVVFVPIPENTLICALKSHLVWATDLASDFNIMQVEKIQNASEQMFIKNNMAITAHVANQKFNVLYAG